MKLLWLQHLNAIVLLLQERYNPPFPSIFHPVVLYTNVICHISLYRCSHVRVSMCVHARERVQKGEREKREVCAFSICTCVRMRGSQLRGLKVLAGLELKTRMGARTNTQKTTRSLSHSHTHSLSHTHTLSRTHTLPLSLTHTHTLTHTQTETQVCLKEWT